MTITLSNLNFKDSSNNSWANLLDLVYPIGSIYISRNNVSPASAMGGSWAALNGVLLAAGNGDMGAIDNEVHGSNFIGINNMPAHSHAVTIQSAGAHTHSLSNTLMGYDPSKHNFARGTGYNYGSINNPIQSAGAHTHTATCANVGGKDIFIPVHANFYVWRRIA